MVSLINDDMDPKEELHNTEGQADGLDSSSRLELLAYLSIGLTYINFGNALSSRTPLVTKPPPVNRLQLSSPKSNFNSLMTALTSFCCACSQAVLHKVLHRYVLLHHDATNALLFEVEILALRPKCFLQ